MRAVVLAAGKGTRLRGVADAVPKPMIPVDGRPILEHNLRWLAAAGITELALNLHHQPQIIRDHCGDGARFGVHIVWSFEEELLGTAGAVRRIADTLWPDLCEPFLIVYGDNLMRFDLGAMLAWQQGRDDGMVTIGVYHKDDVSQSGIVVHDERGRITRFIEKPAPAEQISHLVNAGLYLASPRLIEAIPPGRTIDFGHDIFPALLAAGETLYACPLAGTLIAVDTPALWRDATGQGGAR